MASPSPSLPLRRQAEETPDALPGNEENRLPLQQDRVPSGTSTTQASLAELVSDTFPDVLSMMLIIRSHEPRRQQGAADLMWSTNKFAILPGSREACVHQLQ